MWNHGWYMGPMGGMWLGWLIMVAVVVLAAWAIMAATGPRIPVGPEDPETLLKRRYARGEIDRDEYQRRLEDLRK